MHLVMIDGDFVNPDGLDLAYSDHGLFFGDGVYEVLRSYNGKLFALDEHIARFKRSLSEVEIDGIDIETVRKRVLLAYAKSKLSDAKIYFHITRGSGPRQHGGEGLKPRFFLEISPIDDSGPEKADGISVITAADTRWKRCDIKTLNLLPNVLAKRKAHRLGAQEAIFVDDNGYITEGSSSAFFAIISGELITSPLDINILPSITRQFVLKLHSSVGLRAVERQIKAEQAADADELFVAVSSKGITPVVRFNQKAVGDGKVGRYTKLLMDAFAKMVGISAGYAPI